MGKVIRTLSIVIAALALAFSLMMNVAGFIGSSMFFAVTAAIETVTGLKSHSARQEAEIKTISGDLDAEKRRAAGLTEDLEASRTRATQLDADLDSEKRRAAGLADDLDASRTHATQLEADLNGERRLKSEIADELSASEARYARASARLDELDLDLNSERRLRAEVQDELTESKGVVRTLRSEVADANDLLSRRRTDALAEIVEYRGTRSSVKDAVSDTYLRLSDRSDRIVSREVKGMFAEGVPYFGTAAIVGLTTLEVRDLCTMMRDSNELYYAVNPDERPDDDVPTICSVEIPTKSEVWESAKSAPGAAFQATKEFGSGVGDTFADLGDLDQSDLWSFGLLVLEKSANAYDAGKGAVTVSWSTLLDLWQDWNK